MAQDNTAIQWTAILEGERKCKILAHNWHLLLAK